MKYDTDTLDRIAELWARDLKTLTISQRLKIPHGSVCRLARNARMRGDERFPARLNQPKRKRKALPKLPPPRSVPMVKRKVVRKPPARLLPALKTAVHPRIWELTANQCRYPVEEPEPRDHRFCAKPQKEGSPYCSEHEELCTGAPRPRRTA
jgi:hypothetical protein